MTREEYNEQFLLEIVHHKETGEISDDVKNLLYQLIKQNADSERYEFLNLNEDLKYMCIFFAYEACIKHIWKFNPEKSSNAFSYIVIIIRSSFARTIGNVKDNKLYNI